MARPAQPWTEQDADRRDKLLALADARGITHKRLGEAAGLTGTAGQVRMSRWVRGQTHLADECLAAMSAFLSQQPAGIDRVLPDGEAGPEMTADAVRVALSELDALAGPPPQSEEDELRALARQHRREAVGGIVRLLVSAKSEGVRLRAAEVILERADGKAIQSFIDQTPKAPASDAELLKKLTSLLERSGNAQTGGGDVGATESA